MNHSLSKDAAGSSLSLLRGALAIETCYTFWLFNALTKRACPAGHQTLIGQGRSVWISLTRPSKAQITFRAVTNAAEAQSILMVLVLLGIDEGIELLSSVVVALLLELLCSQVRLG